MDDRSDAASPTPEPSPDPEAAAADPPGRATRGPDEGPALDGGSALDAGDEAAEDEIGGGD